MLARANDVLNHIINLDDAVAELYAYRSMLENLNSRGAIKLPHLHVKAMRVVRAGILRSMISLALAILDQPDRRRGNRASLGQIIELLKDRGLADFLTKPNAKRSARPDRQVLSDACSRYGQLYLSEMFKKMRHLRHHSIAHLLVTDGSSPQDVDYSDIFTVADEIEKCLSGLYRGAGMGEPPFIKLKKTSTEQAKLFWDTYLRGAAP